MYAINWVFCVILLVVNWATYDIFIYISLYITITWKNYQNCSNKAFTYMTTNHALTTILICQSQSSYCHKKWVKEWGLWLIAWLLVSGREQKKEEKPVIDCFINQSWIDVNFLNNYSPLLFSLKTRKCQKMREKVNKKRGMLFNYA